MSKSNHSISGALNINKPKGMTSHDVVAQVRRLINQKKAGHAGTLDPFATGVLLVLVGSATRLGEYMLQLPKTYAAEFILGASSDTDDITGKIVETTMPQMPTREELIPILRTFLGEQQQVPPNYAAVKVKGKKLYEYARAGETIEPRPRTITVHDLKIVEYDYPRLKIEATVSSGTYIRALARDLGEALHTSAYVSQLRRTAIGQFDVTKSMLLSELTQQALPTRLHPPEELISHLPTIILDQGNVAKLKQGMAIPWPCNDETNQFLALFDEQKTLVGIGSCDSAASLLKPTKILTAIY